MHICISINIHTYIICSPALSLIVLHNFVYARFIKILSKCWSFWNFSLRTTPLQPLANLCLSLFGSLFSWTQFITCSNALGVLICCLIKIPSMIKFLELCATPVKKVYSELAINVSVTASLFGKHLLRASSFSLGCH